MTTETAGRRRPVVSLVLFGISLVACVVLGVTWALGANAESAGRALARDEALRDGQSAIISFNTLDYRDVERGLQRWEESSTGPLRDEIRQGRQDYVTQIGQAKSITSARILDAGITEIDENAGKAKLIAVVQTTKTIEGQQPATMSDRFQAELTREGPVWKISGLGQVPVG